MRELQIGEPKVRRPRPVTWLEFAPSGTGLVTRHDNGELHLYDLRADVLRPLFGSDVRIGLEEEGACGYALSPDHRLLAISFDFEGDKFIAFAETGGDLLALHVPGRVGQPLRQGPHVIG